MKRKFIVAVLFAAAAQSPASAFGPPANTGYHRLDWCFTDKTNGNPGTNWMTSHFSFPCFDWL